MSRVIRVNYYCNSQLISYSHNIQENSTPQDHALHVWKNFINRSKAKTIDIVAHSFGGVVTVDLVRSTLY